MALTQEEQARLRNNIITYSEYKEAIDGVIYDQDERDEIDAQTPAWFHKWQNRALALFRRAIAQVHLLPRNRMDYLDLKQDFWIEEGTNIQHHEPMNYQQMFRDALANQIWYMNENEIYFENGWLQGGTGFAIGSYSQSGQHPNYISNMLNDLCPIARDQLDQMGWMNACIDRPMHTEIFYKGEH